MPYKSKEKAWILLVLSVIAFWFKGGLIFIALLWTLFFLVELPRDIKELKKYEKYLEHKSNLKPEKSVSDEEKSPRCYENMEKNNRTYEEANKDFLRVVDEMNEQINERRRCKEEMENE